MLGWRQRDRNEGSVQFMFFIVLTKSCSTAYVDGQKRLEEVVVKQYLVFFPNLFLFKICRNVLIDALFYVLSLHFSLVKFNCFAELEETFFK